ncbi:hypothetical protein TNCV_617261 [Trichonephila clavipes]|nr:hypothetical protein TNCV_617261 [Trichonephila clavipes]
MEDLDISEEDQKSPHPGNSDHHIQRYWKAYNVIIRKANPQVYVETPLHPEKLTVWCALWAGGIIGQKLLQNPQRYSQW